MVDEHECTMGPVPVPRNPGRITIKSGVAGDPYGRVVHLSEVPLFRHFCTPILATLYLITVPTQFLLKVRYLHFWAKESVRPSGVAKVCFCRMAR